MAKVRSHVVSRASCAVVARELDLGDAAARGRRRPRAGGGRPARPQPQRPRGAARGGARRRLPRARLRGRRAGGRRGVRAADRVRAEHPRRPQDRAAGAARPARPVGLLHDAEVEGPPHDRHVHRGRDRRRRGGRHRLRAARRRTPSRVRPSRCSRPCRKRLSERAQRRRRRYRSCVGSEGATPSSSRNRPRSVSNTISASVVLPSASSACIRIR